MPSSPPDDASQILDRLHAVSTAVLGAGDAEALYERALDAAAEIMRADCASIQVLDAARGELRLLGARGFTPEATRFWSWVRPESQSTCGKALRERARVVVPSVTDCDWMIGTEDWKTYLASGIGAVQTTPLVSRAGAVIGMLSTHWRTAHEPAPAALRALDVLARMVADLIDRGQAEEALRERAAWVRSARDALHAAVNRAPLATSLGALVQAAIDALGAGVRVAFYLANEEGTALHHVVGMGAAYGSEVDGVEIGPESLVCALATRTGQPALTADVMEDERWAPWRWLAAKFDYRGCWSFPVHSSAGRFVGTVVFYWTQPRAPAERELELAGFLTDTASVILSQHRDAEARARAEEALRAREEHLRAILESMDEEVWISDADGRLIQVNRAAQRAHGIEANGTSLRELVETMEVLEPDGTPRLPENTPMLKALRGETVTGEEYIRHSDVGELRYRRFSCAPIRDDRGTITGTVAVAKDITNQKKAEEALRESEERMRRLYESGMIGVLHFDLDGPITEANDEFLSMVGYTREDMAAGRIRWDLMTPPEYHGADQRGIAELKASGVDTPYEKEYLRKDGSRVPILIGAATYDDARQRGLAFVLDITERRRAEKESQRLQQELTADLDAMTRLQRIGAMFVQENDLGPILSEIVEAAIAITGADFGNMQVLDAATSTLRIVAQRGFPQWWLDYWTSVSHGQGCCGTALERGERMVVEDVERSPIFAGTPALEIQLRAGVRAVQSTPLFSRSGKPLGMFSTHYRTPRRPDDRALRLLDLLARQASDIIERAQAEASLQDTNARLREADRRKTEFLAVLSHELRNPLAPIRNSIYVLRHAAPGTEPFDRARDVIERQTDHLARLVDDLLDVVRITRGRVELQRERVDLRELVREAMDDVRPTFAQAGIELRVEHALEPTWLDADPRGSRRSSATCCTTRRSSRQPAAP